jgi:NADPH:quinone reductase-like Zn-dependent oxidoreductase
MRAALIKAFGEPAEVLELADVPEPSGPAAGEVLVGVSYAPVNMNDLSLIRGAFPVRPSLPSIVGNEGVGRVLAVGSGVEHLEVGDRVLIPLYAFSWRHAGRLHALVEHNPQFRACRHRCLSLAAKTLSLAAIAKYGGVQPP